MAACNSYIGNCGWKDTTQQPNGIMQDNPFSKKKTPVVPLQSRCPYLSSQQMRVWHYWVLGGSPYLLSSPFYHLLPDGCNLSHFMDERQCLWCKSGYSHVCTAQWLVFATLRGYSSESWILATVLWGDALSAVHTFPTGGEMQVYG